jgi:hypothetical protein
MPIVEAAMAETPARVKPTDPELEALPEPRRPWRRATLVTMVLTAAISLALAVALGSTARFSLRRGPPIELGSLTHVQLEQRLENQWAHGEAELDERSAEYRRPLDPDRFRVAEVSGNDRVWVELRIPSGIEPEHYVPPNSFVGRLVPFQSSGLRHAAVVDAARTVGAAPRDDAWLLIDGEAPATTRWSLGLIALFLAFATFNIWGVLRLLRPVKVR